MAKRESPVQEVAPFVGSLDTSKPTRVDPVSEGADEIRNLKESVRKTFPLANTALKVSNDAINEAITETIPEIASRVNALDPSQPPIGTPDDDRGSAIVASCKYNTLEPNEPNAPIGSPLPYTHNVSRVDIPANEADPTGFGSCRVTFTKPIPNFDRHFSVLIQPYATTNQHVIATVTDQQNEFVEWTWLVYDSPSNTWKVPDDKIGFSFMAVDYEQR